MVRRDMRLSGVAMIGAALCGCAVSPASEHGASPAEIPSRATVPAGVTVGASGYAMLTSAPPLPRPTRAAFPTPVEGGAQNGNPGEAAMRAGRALDRRLQAAEASNYIGYRVVRDPAPRLAFEFRRDADATLARYSRDPRFTAREGGLPRAELQPIFDEWLPRFLAHRLVGGGSVMEFDGVVAFDMTIDEPGFRRIAAGEGWTLPERLIPYDSTNQSPIGRFISLAVTKKW